MITGNDVRLHKLSFCQIDAPNNDLHGQPCNVTAFDAAKKKWKVRLGSGKEVLVAEPRLQLAFSLLPTSTSKLGCYHEVGLDAAQGTCGRGLVAMQDVQRGQPVFQEPPLIIAREDTATPGASDFTATHHEVRWRAFITLATRAGKDAKDGAWARALKAFDDLGIADDVPSHVRDAARTIATRELLQMDGDGTPTSSLRAAYGSPR